MLVLASASPARRRLLEQAAIPHRVQVSGVEEEAIRAADPRELAGLLALAKASAVAGSLSEGWGSSTQSSGTQASGTESSGTVSFGSSSSPERAAVLGCDSLLAFENEIFGKPRDREEARVRWRRMAGRWGELHTGHCLLLPGVRRQATVTTRVLFAAVDEATIAAYVETGEPMACAGGFALEGRGGLLVERIEGCFSNVIGLSLPLLRRWLN